MKLRRQHPADPGLRRDLGFCNRGLGNLYIATRRLDEADVVSKEALNLQEELCKEHPVVATYAVDLALNHLQRARLACEKNQPAASLDSFQRAIKGLNAELNREPQHNRARRFLCSAYLGRADALAQLGRQAESRKDWDQAFELDDRASWTDQRRRAEILLMQGKHAQAVEKADALIRKGPVTSARKEALLRLYGQASLAAWKDHELSLVERLTRSASYASAAVRLFIGYWIPLPPV